MGRRQSLHQILEELADHVYFQPPQNVQIQYPCIMYQRDTATTRSADNRPYTVGMRYMVTVIDADPDSDIPGKVLELPMSQFNRFFTAGNLNHDVFSVYF